MDEFRRIPVNEQRPVVVDFFPQADGRNTRQRAETRCRQLLSSPPIKIPKHPLSCDTDTKHPLSCDTDTKHPLSCDNPCPNKTPGLLDERPPVATKDLPLSKDQRPARGSPVPNPNPCPNARTARRKTPCCNQRPPIVKRPKTRPRLAGPLVGLSTSSPLAVYRQGWGLFLTACGSQADYRQGWG